MTKINVKLIDDNGTNAPLYQWYAGQCQPQPAMLAIELTDEGEDIDVEISYDGTIGGRCGAANGWDYIAIPPNVSREWVEAVQGGAIDSIIEKYSRADLEERREMDEELNATYNPDSPILDPYDIASVYTLEEWLHESTTEELKQALANNDAKSLLANADGTMAIMYDDLEEEVQEIIKNREEEE